MVLIEINHYKTTEVKLNEEMILAIMHAMGSAADDQSITWCKLASEINPETHLQWKHVKRSCR